MKSLDVAVINTTRCQKPSGGLAVDGFYRLSMLYRGIGIVLLNGRSRFFTLVFVQCVLVELVYFLLKAVALAIHEAVVHQIAVIIERERVTAVIPLCTGINANHPAMLKLPFHIVIELIVLGATFSFVRLCREAVVNPCPPFRDTVRANSGALVVFQVIKLVKYARQLKCAVWREDELNISRSQYSLGFPFHVEREHPVLTFSMLSAGIFRVKR